MSRTVYEFGDFRLDPGQRRLEGPGGDPLALTPKPFDALVLLVEHAGEPLSRKALNEALWPNTIVEDNNLTQTISTLRRTIGKGYIITLPARGYQFVGDVRIVAREREAAAFDEATILEADYRSDPDAAFGEPSAASAPDKDQLQPLKNDAGRRWRSGQKAIFLGGAALVLVLILIGSVGIGRLALMLRGGADGVHEPALQALERLVEAGDWEAAFALANESRAQGVDDEVIAEFMPRLSWLVDISSDPPGATVFRRSYDSVDDAWVELGRTPLQSLRIPFGLSHIRLELDGFLPLFRTLGGGLLRPRLGPADPASLDIVVGTEIYRLETAQTLPEGKVRVSAWSELIGGETAEFRDFFIGRHEVTNAEFKVFVDAGGYQRRSLWESVIRDGEPLPWPEAMQLFLDQSGHVGPSAWIDGDYPEGQDDFPVSGISWYEAMAYARFAGQELPTAYHWRRARANGAAPWVLAASHFNSGAPRSVLKSRSMSYVGAYDMAGNVREWTTTALGDGFVIAGGSFADEPYVAAQPLMTAAPPLDRSPANGLRLAIIADEPAARARAATSFDPIPVSFQREPVSDERYAAYGELFAYDAVPLNASLDSEETTRLWTRQRISFDAAYGDERMILYLYLPTVGTPPYQTVIYWPTSAAYLLRSIDDYQMYLDFVVRNGRAVAFPMYAGTFERSNNRGPPFAPTGPVAYRDNLIEGVNDLRRSIDYLQTRADIDAAAFAFFGHSQGGVNAPIVLTREPRLSVGIVYVGFLPPGPMEPLADPGHALPRVDVPVLLLSGEFDSTAPLDAARRYFEVIGTPERDKKHVVASGSHFVPRDVLVAETLGWLDAHLGPVRGQQLGSGD